MTLDAVRYREQQVLRTNEARLTLLADSVIAVHGVMIRDK